MIELHEQEGEYLEMCKHFRAIYDTKKVQENVDDKTMVCLPIILAHKIILIENLRIRRFLVFVRLLCKIST